MNTKSIIILVLFSIAIKLSYLLFSFVIQGYSGEYFQKYISVAKKMMLLGMKKLQKMVILKLE